jgi:N utilization substance protein B
MKKRSLARQLAMKSLFQMTLVSADLEEALEYLRDQESAARDVIDYSRRLAQGAFTHRDEIDGRIRDHLHRWDFSRVGNVEKCILRIAVYELLHESGTPTKVIINEAVELGKEFTTQQSVRFINGILDRVARTARSVEPGAPELPPLEDPPS